MHAYSPEELKKNYKRNQKKENNQILSQELKTSKIKNNHEKCLMLLILGPEQTIGGFNIRNSSFNFIGKIWVANGNLQSVTYMTLMLL